MYIYYCISYDYIIIVWGLAQSFCIGLCVKLVFFSEICPTILSLPTTKIDTLNHDWKIPSNYPIINQTQNWSWNAACTVGENGENATKIFKTSNQKNLNSSKRILWHQWTIPFFWLHFSCQNLHRCFFSSICVCSITKTFKKKLSKSSPETDSILFSPSTPWVTSFLCWPVKPVWFLVGNVCDLFWCNPMQIDAF